MPIRIAVAALAFLALGCRSSDVDHLVLIEVPASVASIPNGALRVSLYRYDPYLMDAPATRVDRAIIAFSHREGQRTIARAHVSGSGTGGERFYLAVNGCAVTAEGDQSVLWDGLEVEMPSFVRMRPREAPFSSCVAVDGE